MSDNQVELFMAKHAIQSLRESDFDDLSAYGEAIDNSLQADASDSVRDTTLLHQRRRDSQFRGHMKGDFHYHLLLFDN